MSEVLVSETVHDGLTQTRQWIDCDPYAMKEMASVLDAPVPDLQKSIYVFFEPDIRKKANPGTEYALPSEDPILTPVYRQGPARETFSVVPNRKVFAVTLRGVHLEVPDPDSPGLLSAATAERLALPRRNRREIAATGCGGAIALASLATLVEGIIPWSATVPATAMGLALMAWGGPKQRLPDTSTMRPPLALRAIE